MAFAARNLNVLAYTNGFTLWHYTSVDTNADVTAGGYFDPVQDMLRKGDLIVSNLDTGGTQVNKLLFVVSSKAGVVVVKDYPAA